MFDLKYIIIIPIVSYFVYHIYINVKMKTLISTLKKRGYKLYVDGSKCGHCVDQLIFFGPYLNQIDIVHCDDVKNKAYCDNIPVLPLFKSNLYPGGREIAGSKLTFSEFDELFK